MGYCFSPEQKSGITGVMLLSKISLHDYEKLCSLGCLGIEERSDNSNYIYEEFQIHFGCGPERFYEMNLIWKENHPPLKIANLKAFVD